MNKDFIPSFIKKGYELKKECYISITSCVNYTYYIVYNKETKDLLILKDSHACLAINKPQPKTIHLEDVYQSLYHEINHIEKIKSQNYETDPYKDSYRNKEQFEKTKNIGINLHEKYRDSLQEFIDTYLDLLKNRYK